MFSLTINDVTGESLVAREHMNNPVMSHMLSPSTWSILVLTLTHRNRQQTVRDKEHSGRV
ncbi:hypothetical protein [Marinomonas spartinae]|uniref:hypothetical protein n=1 Tax=Marinomonas spartinae TaxID=1792290 RepID=UPI0018F13A5F|nr:hypothetical protein [Marinomonas spartinae]MBJ7553769.1 hypothetical protein [Marinomonas spartinae]